MTLESGVPAPVAGNDVQSAVSIQIARRNSVPPSRVIAQTHLFRHFPEPAAFVAKNPDRPPFAGDYQLRLPVPIQIAKDGAAHQSQLLKSLPDHQPPACVRQ